MIFVYVNIKCIQLLRNFPLTPSFKTWVKMCVVEYNVPLNISDYNVLTVKAVFAHAEHSQKNKWADDKMFPYLYFSQLRWFCKQLSATLRFKLSYGAPQ